MKLDEWRGYQKFCKKDNISERPEIRQFVYVRLVRLYGIDAVLKHIKLIKKILDK